MLGLACMRLKMPLVQGATVRAAAVDALTGLCELEDAAAQLGRVAQRNARRLREMMHDVDETVAVRAVGLLGLLVDRGHMDSSEVRQRHVCSTLQASSACSPDHAGHATFSVLHYMLSRMHIARSVAPAAVSELERYCLLFANDAHRVSIHAACASQVATVFSLLADCSPQMRGAAAQLAEGLLESQGTALLVRLIAIGCTPYVACALPTL